MSWEKMFRSLRVKGKLSASQYAFHLAHGSHTWKEHSVIRYAYKKLEAADIKALNTTPYTLIAAPGADKYNVVDYVFGKMTFATAAFTGSNDLEFRYTDGTGAKLAAADFPATGFLNISSATAVRHTQGLGYTTALVPVANALVCAFVPTADPGGTTAAGYLELVIQYRILTFA